MQHQRAVVFMHDPLHFDEARQMLRFFVYLLQQRDAEPQLVADVDHVGHGLGDKPLHVWDVGSTWIDDRAPFSSARRTARTRA